MAKLFSFILALFLSVMVLMPFSQGQTDGVQILDQTDWSGGVGPGTSNQFLRSENMDTSEGSLRLASTQNWYARDTEKAWTYRRKITFDNSDVSEDLLNFPVVLRLDVAAALSDGGDLRFTSEDGQVELPYEIETWNASTHRGVVWVKVPRIAAAPAIPEPIYVYYGNDAATNGESPTSVWSAGYSSVSHFNFPFRDSTKDSAHNSVNVRGGVGVEDVLDGSVGKAVRWSDENKAIYFNDQSATGDTSVDYTGGPLTLSALILDPPDTSSGNILSKPMNGAGIYSYRLLLWDGTVAANFQGAGQEGTLFRSSARLTPHVYHLLTIVVGSDANMKMYIDGVEQPEHRPLTVTHWNATPDNNPPLCLGTLYPYGSTVDLRTLRMPATVRNATTGLDEPGPLVGPGFSFTGIMDEMSISRVARSASWVRAESNQFLNLDPTKSLSRIGSEERSLFSSGFLTSNPFCLSQISWERVVPHLAQASHGMTLKVRTGNNASMEGSPDFSECSPISESGELVDEEGANDCVRVNASCLQYQVTLNQDAVNPVVQRVSLSYASIAPPAPPPPVGRELLMPLLENAGVRFIESEGVTTVLQGQEGSDSVQLTLSARPRATVSVILVADSPVVRLTPSSFVFTPDNWNVPQTIQLQATQALRLLESVTTNIHHTLNSEDPDFNAKNFDLLVHVTAAPAEVITDRPAGEAPQPLEKQTPASPTGEAGDKPSGCNLLIP